MEAFLNVKKQLSGYGQTPLEIHTHDVLLGDLITLEAMGQHYQIHIADITPDTIILEVQGLTPLDGQTYIHNSPFFYRRYSLPRNSTLSFAIPMIDNGPTWTVEWAASQ